MHSHNSHSRRKFPPTLLAELSILQSLTLVWPKIPRLPHPRGSWGTNCLLRLLLLIPCICITRASGVVGQGLVASKEKHIQAAFSFPSVFSSIMSICMWFTVRSKVVLSQLCISSFPVAFVRSSSKRVSASAHCQPTRVISSSFHYFNCKSTKGSSLGLSLRILIQIAIIIYTSF